MWDSTTTKCRRKCEDEGDQADCAADTMCLWDTDNNRCLMKCTSYTDQAICVNDTRCEFNTDGRGLCLFKCFYRYNAKGPCENDKQCMWSNKNSRCEMECARHGDQNTCTDNIQCEWPTTKCRRKCFYEYA